MSGSRDNYEAEMARGWVWLHDHQARLIRRDGLMCERHPGRPFGHNPSCGGPGVPWIVEGRANLERRNGVRVCEECKHPVQGGEELFVMGGLEVCDGCSWRITNAETPSYQTIAERLPAEIHASAVCPLCAHTGMHEHTPLEIVIYRNGVKYGRSLGGEESSP